MSPGPSPDPSAIRSPQSAVEFIHRFIAPQGGKSTRTLLLLHGTGGDENDLLPLGEALDPDAAILSPRGKVLERGMPRFFRRLAEGVFDHEDLVLRTHELAAFLQDASRRYGFAPDSLIAAGFSNGANIAASLLLLHPGLLRGAILLSPMVPFEPETMPALSGTRVFIGAGRGDPIAPAAQAERLGQIFSDAGAAVTMYWHAGGHALTPGEVGAARDWLAQADR